jgi:hypothetical protein
MREIPLCSPHGCKDSLVRDDSYLQKDHRLDCSYFVSLFKCYFRHAIFAIFPISASLWMGKNSTLPMKNVEIFAPPSPGSYDFF